MKKWNPIFFLSQSYSEPESVAKSILTNKKAKLQMDLHYTVNHYKSVYVTAECKVVALLM